MLVSMLIYTFFVVLLTLTNIDLQILGNLVHGFEVSRVEVMVSDRSRGDLSQLVLDSIANAHSKHFKA